MSDLFLVVIVYAFKEISMNTLIVFFQFFWLFQGTQAAPAPVTDPALLFNVITSQTRNLDDGNGGYVPVSSFEQVLVNKNNSFSPVSGLFTAPAEGVYHFSARFRISEYRCHTTQDVRIPGMTEIQVVSNSTTVLQRFLFLPGYNSTTDPNARPFTESKFDVLVKLKRGETIQLKIKGKKCFEGKIPQYYRAEFSGMQII